MVGAVPAANGSRETAGLPTPSFFRSVQALLPRGLPLPDSEWQARHRFILALLWVHVPLLFGFAIYMGFTASHSAFEVAVIALPALLATLPRLVPGRWQRWERSIRSTMAGFGLVTSSAILTHLSGGYIEMHFHFFVMVAVMAFYQEWPPFLMAILFVALHHGIAGVLDPASVYNHPDAIAKPWKWAGIHAFFIVCASAAAMTAWRFSEEARLKTVEANQEMAETLSLLGATLDSTADGILVVDNDGRITSHNEKFADMWRIPKPLLESRDDGKVIESVLDQLENPEVFVAKVRQLYAHPDEESFDLLHFRDGRVFERYSKPQQLEGQTRGRVWSFRDITERQRAEQERILSQQRLMDIQRLEEVNEFKTQLLNTASHELNTPLTPLRLQLHLLQDPKSGPLTAKQRKSVEVLDRNIERLGGLVQNVLDVARLQSNQLRLNLQKVDVRGLAQECVDAFEEAARRANIRLEVAGRAKGGRLEVTADAPRVTQVFFNLVSNALKFTPGGGAVTIHLERKEDVVNVRVIDTGRGMSPAEMAQLFQPFSQIEAALAENPSGTGLGLYISKGIVEAHGGHIHVESAGPAQGSTFWFTLPIQAVSPSRGRDGADAAEGREGAVSADGPE